MPLSEITVGNVFGLSPVGGLLGLPAATDYAKNFGFAFSGYGAPIVRAVLQTKCTM
ncbi:hypothetical protein IU474_08655 [Nocardia otitidiscaviarum]|uniref:hypothetical protein n=1 Tax=Nocardia otitidiscaviarum TaxID=1823 RepID=UPI00189535C0|nr:hypothetical protein [Nocardia otitidiscaviarum]MBF6237136.1 hypothetical protein [Nocardia otitidiscaviarum]